MTGRSSTTRSAVSTGSAWILLLALTVAAVLTVHAVSDPEYSYDAGYRAFFAERPVVKLGNRVWLPFVQLQIFLYYTLGLPVAGLKLITVAYSTAAVAFLALYWRRVLGGNSMATVAAVLAGALFAAQSLVSRVTNLMQEPPGAALLFAFVWLASRPGPISWVALPIGCAAMLTRDAYWIYLLAITLVDLRAWPWAFRRLVFYAGLWATPIAWMGVCVPALYLVAYGRLPEIPIEWPLMYNPAATEPTLARTLDSLWAGLVDSRSLHIAGGLLVATGALLSWRRGRFFSLFDHDPFAGTVLRAAPIALAIVYGLIVAVDPWQETPGNARMAWPLVEVCFVVAPLLVRAAFAAPKRVRVVAVTAIALGLTAGARTDFSLEAEKNALLRSELSKIDRLLTTVGQGVPVDVCMRATDRWEVFRYLNAPTFYHRQTFLAPEQEIPAACRVMILEENAGLTAPEDFEHRETIRTGGLVWSAHIRR